MDQKPFSSADPVQILSDLQSVGSTAQPRPQLGISPVYSERFLIRTRFTLAEGLDLISATGLGLDRTGSIWRALEYGLPAEEESLVFQDTGLELNPMRGITVRVSTRLAREVDAFGRVRSDWSGGAAIKWTPSQWTSLNVGAYRSERMETHFLSNVFTAGLDSRLGKTPLTLSVNGWFATGAQSASASEKYSAAGATGLVSCQWSNRLWLGAGAQWDSGDGWEMNYASWRCYFSTQLKVSPQISFGCELSRTHGSSCYSNTAAASSFDETRLRLSQFQRFLDNFATELSVEMALETNGTEPLGSGPLARIAAQFTF